MRENSDYSEKAYVPSVVSWTPLAIIMILFIIMVIIGIGAINQAIRLKVATEEIATLNRELADVSAKLAVAEDQLAMPVFVEVVYDPDETIYTPADPNNATRLQWRIGQVGDLPTAIRNDKMFLVGSIDLMSYRVLLSGGGDMIGNTDLLPAVVRHATEQRQELFAEVDNSGFIDR